MVYLNNFIHVIHFDYYAVYLKVPASYMGFNGSNELLEAINDSPRLLKERVTGPLIWVQYYGWVKRDPITKSLYNTTEGFAVARFSSTLAQTVGVDNVCVVAPYKKQVSFILYIFIKPKLILFDLR